MQPREQLRKISPIQLLAILGTGVASTTTAGYFLYKWGKEVPPGHEESVSDLFRPGWPETLYPNRPAFIKGEGEEGHRPYLRYMDHDPFIRSILTRAYTDLAKETPNRSAIADVFDRHVRYADEIVLPLGGTKTDSVHLAFFTLASMYSDLYSPDDILTNFGVNLPVAIEYRNKRQWIINYCAYMPEVFKTDNGTEYGVDKVMHFVNFAFLFHEFERALKYNQNEAIRIPKGARMVAVTSSDSIGDALQLGTLAAFILEGIETKNWVRGMLEKNQIIWPPHMGFLDPDVGMDNKANLLGMYTAVLLAKEPITPEYYASVIERLRDPEKLLKEMGGGTVT